MQTNQGFNERKATQVAAHFLAAARERTLPYMKLIKLMYLVDREAIKRWGGPVTDDTYYALNYGMVLSQVKELIDEGEGEGVWTEAIEPAGRYDVKLVSDPGEDELSRAEIRLVEEIRARYGSLSKWELSELTHTFPEWKHPNGSSIPVRLSRIAMALGLSPAEASEMESELRGVRRMRALAKK